MSLRFPALYQTVGRRIVARCALSTRRLSPILTVALIVAVAVFNCSVYYTMLLAPAVGTYHDDGVYAVTAKALANGQGYRIISMPGEPWQTKYPILFPALLALIWRIAPVFPDNVVWLRMVPLASSAAWLSLSWLLLRRLGASKSIAAVLVVLVATTQLVAFLSTALLSETLFAALVTAALLVLTRNHRGCGTRFDGFFAGLLLGAAVITRAAGVAPAAAGLIALALSRHWRACVQYCLAIAAFALPWIIWVLTRGSAAGAEAYYTALNYGSWNIVGSYEPAAKVGVFVTNLLRLAVAPLVFWGIKLPTSAALGAAVLFVVFLVRGLWRAWREPAALAATASLLLTMLWVWPPIRFLIPIAPILLWYTYIGAGKPRRLGAALAAVLCFVSAVHLWNLADEAEKKGATWTQSDYADQWGATRSLLDWVSANTSKETVLAGNLDPQYFLYTGRKSIRAFAADPFRLYYNRPPRPGNPLGTIDQFCTRLRRSGAEYLILQPSKDSARRLTCESS